jgi:hypothetical protein
MTHGNKEPPNNGMNPVYSSLHVARELCLPFKTSTPISQMF